MKGDEVIKSWILLIYANGNNELAPETFAALDELRNTAISEDMGVLIQCSFEKKAVIQVIRTLPLTDYPEEATDLKGIYELKEGLTLVEEMNTLNLADPKSLYHFLAFAFQHYPAERYGLYLGGHIYQFVGMSPDYSSDTPSILGFPEMKKALEEACKDFNKAIDILFLDTCYASTLEVLYELSSKENYIKTLFTFLGRGPMNGLPLGTLAKVISQNLHLDTEPLLKVLIHDLNPFYLPFGAIALALKKDVLDLYKDLLSALAYSYLKHKASLGLDLKGQDLLSLSDPNLPWAPLFKPFNELHRFLILHRSDGDEYSPWRKALHVLYKFIPDDARKKLYYRLSFCQNSYWFNFIGGYALEEPLPPFLKEGTSHSLATGKESPSIYEAKADSSTLIKPYESLEPLKINKEILETLLTTSNPWLSKAEVLALTEKLITLKRWNL